MPIYNSDGAVTLLGMEESPGQRVKALRKRLGKTQGQLAHEAKVDAATVSRLELDKVRPELATMERIASVLGTTATALLGVADAAGTDRTPWPSLERFLEVTATTREEAKHLGSTFYSFDPGEQEWSDRLAAYRALKARVQAEDQPSKTSDSEPAHKHVLDGVRYADPNAPPPPLPRGVRVPSIVPSKRPKPRGRG